MSNQPSSRSYVSVLISLCVIVPLLCSLSAFGASPPPNPIAITMDAPVTYSYAGKEAWYSFELTSGEGVTISLSAQLSKGGLYGCMYDAVGNQIACLNHGYDGINNGETGTAGKRVFTNGTYYFKVWGTKDAAGMYDLAVYNAWFNAGVTDAQRSFYSTNYTARYLGSGQYSSSSLKAEAYRFSAQANSEIDISLAAHLNRGGVYGCIYDLAGNQIACLNHGYNGINDGETGTLAKTIYAQGVYYFNVWESSDTSGCYDISVTGVDANLDSDGEGLLDIAENYHCSDILNADTNGNGVPDSQELDQGLSPSLRHQYTLAEVQPALDRVNAIPIPYFDAPFGAPYSGKETWYSFDLTSGEGVTISLGAHLSKGGLYGCMYDAAGNQLECLNHGYDGVNDGETGIAGKRVFVNGTYYFKVWGASDAAGYYDLAVYNAWFNAGATDAQRSFYSTTNAARYLADGQYTVSPLKVEVYRFSTQTSSQIDISLAAHLNRGGVYGCIYDLAGNQIACLNHGYDGINDGETGTLTKTIYAQGVYYFKVWESSDTSGYYDISATGMDSDKDSDGDGLFDIAEYYHGSDINHVDTNGNGISDYKELDTGLCPSVGHEYGSEEVQPAVDRAHALIIPYFDEPFRAPGPNPKKETWYSFDLGSGDGVTITLSAHLNKGGLYGCMYDASGNQLECLNHGYDGINDGEIGLANKKVFVAGAYYFKVWGTSDATGSYDLVFYNAWFNAGAVDSQRDFYSTSYTARYINDGHYSVSPLKVEVYRFSAAASSQLDISLAAHLNRGGVYGCIYDTSDNQIACLNHGYDGINDGETGAVSKVVYAQGIYYFKVWSSSDTSGYYDITAAGMDIDKELAASFSASPTTGSAPLSVSFTDKSQGVINSWLWSFGDGGTGADRNPSHTYQAPGTYTVSLKVTGPEGSDTETKTAYITVTEQPPKADFTASPTSGPSPLEVKFSDQSKGSVTSWTWSFGDGGASTDKNPTHVYKQPGAYTVSLNVKGAAGSDVETKQGFITVDQPGGHGPDLVITAVSGPSSGIVGQSIRLVETAKNKGDELAGACKVGLYLSKDAAFSSSDILLGSIEQWELAAGASAQASANVTIPTNVQAGSYYLIAVADMANKVAESNETNNARVSTRRISVTPLKADLVVSEVSGPDTAKAGATIEVYTRVSNQGTLEAGPFTVELYFSKDAAIKVDDIYLRDYDLVGLKAKQNVRTKSKVAIPKDLAPGKYYLGAIADTGNTVNELNENNNGRASLKTIQITK